MNTSGIVRLRASRDKAEAECALLRQRVAVLERELGWAYNKLTDSTNDRQRVYWLGYDHGKANQNPVPPKESA